MISPLLFNMYSEFMIKEAMKNVEGNKFNRINITTLGYADDAVFVADKKKENAEDDRSINNILRPFFHTKAQVRRYQQFMLDLILAHASRTECPSGSVDPILVAFSDFPHTTGVN